MSSECGASEASGSEFKVWGLSPVCGSTDPLPGEIPVPGLTACVLLTAPSYPRVRKACPDNAQVDEQAMGNLRKHPSNIFRGAQKTSATP